ncbi:thiamine diphosphokinase [Paenibacillus sp. YIM B09110]|uniref:thiamine diphosphokinase n=1 Tax=Paenibacillus sp. YIM B09110 TaxID=3126102 RepID=UPI00301D7816
MTHRIIIFTGGLLGDWALEHITEDDLLIGADSGARFLVQHGLRPDIAIGDFDSVSDSDLAVIRGQSAKTIACDPIDKDFTDTEMAFRLALDLKPQEVMLLGALGTRFDHSLANVHLLALADELGISASIIDQHNIIYLASTVTTVHKRNFANVSLLPLSMEVTGITLHGFQYPLAEATLSIGMSLGISNVLLDETGILSFREGKLLIIQSRD